MLLGLPFLEVLRQVQCHVRRQLGGHMDERDPAIVQTGNLTGGPQHLRHQGFVLEIDGDENPFGHDVIPPTLRPFRMPRRFVAWR